MNIVFRVDSSHLMGTGHVMRCMVLASALRDTGHTIIFICRELTGNIISTLTLNGYSVIKLPYNIDDKIKISSLPLHQQWLGTSPEIDLQQTLALLSSMPKIDYLIIDHYGLDVLLESACRKYTTKIMVIDDLADRLHDADILLDQNYYNDPKNRYLNLTPSTTKTLIGPSYALLRSEFREARKMISKRTGTINRLMVSLGGTDPLNATRKILEGIQKSNYRELPVDVILGSTSQHKDDIQTLCKTQPHYFFHCPSTKIAEIMKSADLAIGAGGTSTWERCCLGLPSLVVKVADNQKELIEQGCHANLFDYLGDIITLNPLEIADKLNTLNTDSKKLQKMSQNGLNTVDGLGKDRVIKEMMTIYG